MAIYTITGQPRNGKSLRVVKELYKLQDENDKLEKQGKPRRKIYIDIAGINSDDVDVYFDDCITDLTKEQKKPFGLVNMTTLKNLIISGVRHITQYSSLTNVINLTLSKTYQAHYPKTPAQYHLTSMDMLDISFILSPSFPNSFTLT